MATDFDTIIVGAGVIGLAIARQLSMSGQSVLVMEKANRAEQKPHPAILKSSIQPSTILPTA